MGTETKLKRNSFVKHELNMARVGLIHLESAADEGREEGCSKDSLLNERVLSTAIVQALSSAQCTERRRQV